MRLFIPVFVAIFFCYFATAQQATTKRSVARRIKQKMSAGFKKKVSGFREWLKWDAECKFLRKEEREIRVAKGRCPPLKTKPAPKKEKRESFWQKRKRQKGLKRTSIFSHGSKKKFLSVITMGQQSVDEIDISPDHALHRLIAGTMLMLSCDAANRNTSEEVNVQWFVNTNVVESSLLDWRVSVTPKGELSIWPISLDDSGHYECTVGGFHQASAVIEVITMKQALLEGFANYFIVAAFYLPIACFAIFWINNSATKAPEKSEREDRMAAFLEEHVMKNGQEAKENIAKVVYGENFKKKKEQVEKSVMTGVGMNGEKLRGNRDTIMTILSPPQNAPTEVRTSGVRKRKTGKARTAVN